MTGSSRSQEELDHRRRRARFRAWHRGMRETDLVLGGFADREIAAMAEAELAEFETLMEEPDAAILDWLTGRATVPVVHDTALFARIAEFCRQGAPARDR